jgi:drug/metabolite transporter (DMT)-like permease
MKMITDRISTPYFALAVLALAMGIIPLNDALFKLMSRDVSLGQLVALRAGMALVALGLFSHSIGAMLALPAKVFWLFFGRGMCLVLAMVLFFVSLGTLPLANVIAIFFVSPMIITILSVPFLGEKIGFHRLAAVSAGMAGVLFIIRPGGVQFQVETLFVVMSAFSYAAFQIWTRRLKAVGNLAGMIGTQHICYLVVGLGFMGVNMIWPVDNSGNPTVDFLLRAPSMMSATHMGYLLICSFSVLLLSFASSNAYRSVEASVIAPFEYVAIPLGVVWGILIWDEWPDQMVMIGILLILAGGLYTLYRENVQSVDVITSSPMPAAAAIAQPPEDELPQTGDDRQNLDKNPDR